MGLASSLIDEMEKAICSSYLLNHLGGLQYVKQYIPGCKYYKYEENQDDWSLRKTYMGNYTTIHHVVNISHWRNKQNMKESTFEAILYCLMTLIHHIFGARSQQPLQMFHADSVCLACGSLFEA